MTESNLDKYKTDLKRLLELSYTLQNDLIGKIKKQVVSKAQKVTTESFFARYQEWYTEAQEVVKLLIPSRYEEFVALYREPKRKNVNIDTYGIQDWMLGTRAGKTYGGQKHYDDETIVYMKFRNQIMILESGIRKFTSSLLNIKQLLQADLFDSEIEVSRELLKKGFVRAAGAIAGVILERHLNQSCQAHKIVAGKQKPTINDFNTLLKEAEVIEMHQWRFIQHLGDLRNFCDHNKEREPKPEEVEELINGVEKITKTGSCN